MNLKRSDVFWDRTNLNNINDNWSTIERLLTDFQIFIDSMKNFSSEPKDGSVTSTKIADKSITNLKLSDQYNAARVLQANEDVTKINREGLYFLSSNTSYVGVPDAVNIATFSGILRVSAYSQYHYTQEIHDLNNNGIIYSRVVKIMQTHNGNYT